VWHRALVCVVLLLASTGVKAQRRPDLGRSPDPRPNRIEVRFALGDQTLVCKRFSVIARYEGRVVLSGKFAHGFDIPSAAKDLPRKDALDLEITCGRNRWHFSQVGERAFLWGYWWVGTDYPPFQTNFAGSPTFKDAAWIHYLLVDPSGDSGFYVYKYCPEKLKNVKPGPCYE